MSKLSSLVAVCVFAGSAVAQSPSTPAAAPAPETLFRNVRVFDGTSARLSAPTDVLVRGNLIAAIGSNAGTTAGQVIDGNGRTLMPGLIDNHAHPAWSLTPGDLNTGDPGYITLRGAQAAKETLLRGWTSIRDLGGPVFGIRRAINEGRIDGPRIWAAGVMISQTSGHSDTRSVADLPSAANRGVDRAIRLRFLAVADGVPEMHTVVREQLMQGANFIKLAVGGGVGSDYDPLDVTEYTPPEVAAALQDAENWGTYVAVHAYTPRAIRMALNAGVKVIEHGQLLDEPTAQLMAEKGAWLSMQPFLDDEDAVPFAPESVNRMKQLMVTEGTARAYELARKHNIKLAFGTDISLNEKGFRRQNAHLPKLARWFTPAQILKMATHDNAQLLALSGPRNPYPGKLGVVEVGALADLLLVNGDPLADINIVANPEANFLVIMKDGKVFKNVTTSVAR